MRHDRFAMVAQAAFCLLMKNTDAGLRGAAMKGKCNQSWGIEKGDDAKERERERSPRVIIPLSWRIFAIFFHRNCGVARKKRRKTRAYHFLSVPVVVVVAKTLAALKCHHSSLLALLAGPLVPRSIIPY